MVQVHLVEMNVRLASVQPEGRGRSNEMDLVAARREFNAELRGDDAAAAVRGVAGNADLAFGSHQAFGCSRSGRRSNLPRTMVLRDPGSGHGTATHTG